MGQACGFTNGAPAVIRKPNFDNGMETGQFGPLHLALSSINY